MRRVGVLLLIGCVGIGAFGMSFAGNWDLTLQLLPTTTLFRSNLTLKYYFAPGWRIESESRFYTGGEYRYQNFYFSGSLGDFGVWGKIYFHARDVRYQKLWVNAEAPLFEGKLRLSFNHWSTMDEYTTVIPVEALFPWTSDPTAPMRSRYENKYYTVYGTVVAYYRTSTYLNIYMVDDYPKQRFIIYTRFADIPEGDLKAWLGVTDWSELVGKKLWVYGKIVNYESPTGVNNPEIQLFSLAYIRDYRLKNIGYGDPEPSSDEKMFGTWPCTEPVANRVAASKLIPWTPEKQAQYENKYYFVYGEVKGYYRTSSYVRLDVEDVYNNPRFTIYIPFSTIPEARLLERFGISSWSDIVNKKVWVYGKIVTYAGNPQIAPQKIGDLGLGEGPKVWPSWGPFINWRLRYTLGQYTLTADLWDCCGGTTLGKVAVSATGIPFLCCGLYLDLDVTFTKAKGLEKLAFSLGDLSLCCGITAKISGEFAPTYKLIKFEPTWSGLSGCLAVYGNVNWSGNAVQGIELYGFDVICYTAGVKFRTLTAFNPTKIEELTDIPFYLYEFEYVELEYAGAGCCGGSLSFTAGAWFGTRGTLFGLQRFKVRVEVPLAANATLFSEGHWNLMLASPLLWFDVGFRMSF